MSLHIVEVVHSIRTQLSTDGMSKLEETFRHNSGGSASYNYEDFEAVLNKVGVFLPRQEQTRLYRHFDTSGEEQLDWQAFCAAVKGEQSARRAAMIEKVWAEALGGGESCTAAAHSEAFNADGHPDVATGSKSGDQISRELSRAMFFCGIQDQISREQFTELWASVSAGSPYDDEHFVSILAGCYGVAEDDSSNQVSQAFLNQVATVLWEKARQRCKGASSESENIRLALNKLDLDDSGRLNQDSFRAGLENFGINLAERVSSALFEAHAEDGTVNIASFAKWVDQVGSA